MGGLRGSEVAAGQRTDSGGHAAEDAGTAGTLRGARSDGGKQQFRPGKARGKRQAGRHAGEDTGNDEQGGAQVAVETVRFHETSIAAWPRRVNAQP